MIKIGDAVRKETGYISLWVLIFSAVLQAFFLVLKRWDYTVLLGNLLSGSGVILNFFLMGLSIQKALEKEEKEAKSFMKLSQSYRFLFLAVIVIIGVVFSCFHTWAVILPLFFPRIAIFLRPFFNKNHN